MLFVLGWFRWVCCSSRVGSEVVVFFIVLG